MFEQLNWRLCQNIKNSSNKDINAALTVSARVTARGARPDISSAERPCVVGLFIGTAQTTGAQVLVLGTAVTADDWTSTEAAAKLG